MEGDNTKIDDLSAAVHENSRNGVIVMPSNSHANANLADKVITDSRSLEQEYRPLSRRPVSLFIRRSSAIPSPAGKEEVFSPYMEINGPPGPSGQLLSPITPESIASPKDFTPENKKNDEEAFICHYCDAKFKIRGYLTRHIRKHAIEKAFKCPYFNATLPKTLRCHSTGGFSRRDTFKIHLKSRHFIFPNDVKVPNKTHSGGNCKHCQGSFSDIETWINDHVGLRRCRAIQKEVSDDIMKDKKKVGNKLKMIKTSNGKSRFISTLDSIVEPKVLLNEDAIEAMAIVANNTNRSDVLLKDEHDKLVLNSANFEGYKKPKRKYQTKKRRLKEEKEVEHTQNSKISTSMQFNAAASSDFITPTSNTPMSSFSSQENVIPLDCEQASSHYDILQEACATATPVEPIEISINATLERQMIPAKLGERHLNEVKQYLNFYNYSFDCSV
ncbi:hypothetical protein KAFR_0C05710 [Kazachstania africana CBS 2517]|uniref:Transcription factor STP1 n=1 Tax=Kazachstania africana (strain ATCC 22294 / BCRC 22015 / CBS 2517 / CECT 1963 / NBRC 1671 / NRRL Y-8276) TaxID=1071382 RepID=H2AT62_KAZAF|nr:hypothetical protein KAFR_0C05710 [Kazachstania africana CBS 2517]CCF57562.1 hypothetical protein KAFR_0C05710 [Kazachstania africana CBS 2517]